MHWNYFQYYDLKRKTKQQLLTKLKINLEEFKEYININKYMVKIF